MMMRSVDAVLAPIEMRAHGAVARRPQEVRYLSSAEALPVYARDHGVTGRRIVARTLLGAASLGLALGAVGGAGAAVLSGVALGAGLMVAGIRHGQAAARMGESSILGYAGKIFGGFLAGAIGLGSAGYLPDLLPWGLIAAGVGGTLLGIYVLCDAMYQTVQCLRPASRRRHFFSPSGVTTARSLVDAFEARGKRQREIGDGEAPRAMRQPRFVNGFHVAQVRRLAGGDWMEIGGYYGCYQVAWRMRSPYGETPAAIHPGAVLAFVANVSLEHGASAPSVVTVFPHTIRPASPVPAASAA